ncbi:MAG: heparan-alpha-glucosaminide N-acetyltransferase domain-containing protein [Promethearchaeota archaeon]
MKRFASVDFLRGLAIVMMIVLHIISDTLDIDALVADLSNLPILQIILLIVLPFLGGLAGFFLIISSIGNMISMQRQLKRGMNSKILIIRQVMSGSLLLLFAMLSESLIGYHGTLGEVFKHLNNLSGGKYDQGLWRFLYFETINTIAWCVILNGIVHVILTRNGKWKNSKYLIKWYAILTIVVLALTPVMWALASAIIPGYPYAIDLNTGRAVELAVIGKTSFLGIIVRFFLGPLAASWEPVFPYLAASFLGSMLGVYISQDRDKKKLSSLKNYLKIGLIMFIVGGIGVILNIFLVMNSGGLDPTLTLYLNISEHRYWTIEHGAKILGWLFQFLFLNGFTIIVITLTFRLVEFRGMGKKFAEKTKFIRRMGFIAFTIYTAQWIYNFFYFVVSSIFGTPYVRSNWGTTILIITFTLLTFHLLTLGWERIGYIGSPEYVIKTISALAIPGKKSRANLKWWQKGKLNVQGAFYSAEWIDIVGLEDIDHARQSESRLSYKLGIIGFLFVPFSLMAFLVAKKSIKSEKPNKWNKKGEKLAIYGIIFFCLLLILFSIVKLSMVGISL